MQQPPARLAASSAATATAAGVATVSFVVPFGQRWMVTGCAVVCSSAAPMPIAKVYRSTVEPAAFLGGTYTGALDTAVAPGAGHDFEPGETLIVQWTGAAAASRCTATLAGTVTSR